MKKKILSLLLAAAMVVGLFPVTASALRGGGVPYLDESGTQQSCTDSAAITSDMTAWGAEGTETWYLASGTVSIEGRVTAAGDVNLILEDGAKLTVSGITVQGSNSLTVYGQILGTGVLTSNGAFQDAGIGTRSEGGGTVTINGGIVNANGGEYGAGIGGGQAKPGGSIVINGGTVNATGGRCGAGIGGGNGGDCGTVTVNGGVVNATGNGGGAGIGGGDYASYGGDGGTVTINGGFVTVKGSNASAGIGAGNGRTAHGSLTVSDGAAVRSSASLDGNLSATTVSAYDSSRDLYVVIDAPYKVSACYFDSFGKSYQVSAYPINPYTTELSSLWYVVNGDITVSDSIAVAGVDQVNLILADGASLTAEKGISIAAGKDLFVYGQENGTGELIAAGESDTAGIKGGNIAIYGGTVTATGSGSGSGISCTAITIGGGTVTAESGTDGFGIECTESSNDVTISGGFVTATGNGSGSGIGGSYDTIVINSGTVAATGGAQGSGIGGNMSSGKVRINGGSIEAKGNMGGIRCDDLTIQNGKVVAYSNGTLERYAAFPVNSMYVNSSLVFKAGSSAEDAVVISNSGYGTQYYAETGPDIWKLLQNAMAGTGSSADGEFTASEDSTSGAITVTLENDIVCANKSAGTLTIPDGKTVILDLNGHVLNGNGCEFSMITVGTAATFELCDSDAKTDHYFTKDDESGLWALAADQTTPTDFCVSGGVITGAGNGSGNNGGCVNVNGGTFNMTGGNITGNKASSYGGGVYVNNGAFNMTGDSTVSGNYASQGAGVYAGESAEFTMSGNSRLTGNAAKAYGGGVGVNKGSFTMSENSAITENTGNGGGGVYTGGSGVFNMTGGNISLNTAAQAGGGVVVSGGTITVSGGSISCNTANAGGGIYSAADVALGAAAQITGNVTGGTITDGELSGGTAGNIYLRSGKYIIVGSKTGSNEGNGIAAPESGMSAGVTLEGGSGIFTGENDADYSAFFTSDAEDYKVIVLAEDGNKLKLAAKYDVAVDPEIANGAIITDAEDDMAFEGDTVTLTVAPADGFELKEDSLKAVCDDGTDEACLLTQDGEDSAKYTFTMPACGVIVTAEFEEPVMPDITVTSAADPDMIEAGGSVVISGKVMDRDIPVTEGEVTVMTDMLEMSAALDTDGSYSVTFNDLQGPDPIVFNIVYSDASGDYNASVTVEFEVIPAVYTVTFDANGHGTAPAAIRVTSGSAITVSQLPALTEEGYVFGGWFKEAACEDPWSETDIVESDMTLYAKWTEEPAPAVYTVTFDANGHGTAPAAIRVTSGSAITVTQLPALTEEGYVFGGWFKEAGCENAWSETDIVESDMTLYAKWTEEPAPTPSGDDPDPVPTVSVPVSGDENTIKVQASVSGNTAVVRQIKDSEIEKVIGSDVETGVVKIDLSGMKKNITGVKLPVSTVEAIAEAAADTGNDTTGLELIFSSGALEFDAGALRTFADEAGTARIIEIRFDEVGTKRLNQDQKAAIMEKDVVAGFEAYVAVNGIRISDFGGGSAIVRIPCEIPADRNDKAYNVLYAAEDGTVEVMKTAFDGKTIRFKVDHFSDYVLVYDETFGRFDNCPKDDSCPMNRFDDVDMSAWYHDGVHYCLDNGIMDGKSETVFAPTAKITRGEIITMLWRMEGEPAVNCLMQFKDVDADMYYTEAVRWAASEKIVEGYTAESFGPNDLITREQLAAILYRYAQNKGEGFTGSWMFPLPFGDSANIQPYADEAVHWCHMKGIIEGKDGNVFDPQGNATRAEAACMIQRFCERS